MSSRSSTRSTSLAPAAPARTVAGPESDEDVQGKHPSVPDVRGGGPVTPGAPQYQPPKEHLGINPTNQYIPEPTPTAAGDRSVPDAPVVGGGEREPSPGEGQSAQQTAVDAGAAWAPGMLGGGEEAPAEGSSSSGSSSS